MLDSQGTPSVSVQPILNNASRLLNDVATVHAAIVELPATSSCRNVLLGRSSSLIGHVKVVISRMPADIKCESDYSVVRDIGQQIDNVIAQRDKLINDIQVAVQAELKASTSSGKPLKLRKKLCDNPKSKNKKQKR